LLLALKDNYPFVRSGVVGSLGNICRRLGIEDKQVINALVMALSDEDDGVRMVAAIWVEMVVKWLWNP